MEMGTDLRWSDAGERAVSLGAIRAQCRKGALIRDISIATGTLMFARPQAESIRFWPQGEQDWHRK